MNPVDTKDSLSGDVLRDIPVGLSWSFWRGFVVIIHLLFSSKQIFFPHPHLAEGFRLTGFWAESFFALLVLLWFQNVRP